MEKFIIISDTNSGIMQEEAKELGIEVVAMPFNIDGEEHLEGVDLSQEKFYESLISGCDIKTSQPSLMYLEEMWERLLKDYEQILYIPTSSGLSGTYDNASRLAENYNNKVIMVNNKRISCHLKESVLFAIELKKQGKSAEEIKTILEETKHKQTSYIVVDTLKYLKKGGRVSPTAATIGTMLNVKPILYTRGETFDKCGFALSIAQAKKTMIKKVKFDMENEFKEDYEKGYMTVSVAHAQNMVQALKFKEEILKELPLLKFRFVDDVSLSVACHVGPGMIAITASYNDTL
jgi:DegV family protein with EDD domain